MSNHNIINNIRKLRFDHEEMTQQQLADLVQVTRQTIVAIEKGKYSPSLELAFKIAEVFSTPLEDDSYWYYQEPDRPQRRWAISKRCDCGYVSVWARFADQPTVCWKLYERMSVTKPGDACCH